MLCINIFEECDVDVLVLVSILHFETIHDIISCKAKHPTANITELHIRDIDDLFGYRSQRLNFHNCV